MKFFRQIIEKLSKEEIQSIIRYVFKAVKVTYIIGILVLLVGFLFLLVSGNFESFIVSTDLKYDAPIFKWLIWLFLIAEVFLIIYGISLCLYKYKRPGSKGIKQGYKNGSSYQALASKLSE